MNPLLSSLRTLKYKPHNLSLLFRDHHVRFEDLPHQAQARQEDEAEPSDPSVDQVRWHFTLREDGLDVWNYNLYSRMRTGNTIRYNAKRRHWRRTKLGL